MMIVLSPFSVVSVTTMGYTPGRVIFRYFSDKSSFTPLIENISVE